MSALDALDAVPEEPPARTRTVWMDPARVLAIVAVALALAMVVGS